MDKKVLVVDLDGTLYNCNTFHEFLKFLVGHFLKKAKVVKLNVLLILLKLRFIRVISHARLKFQVLKLIRDESIDIQVFISKIASSKNSIDEVLDASYDLKILATAAPNYYANTLAKLHGFDACLATDFPETGFNENFENLGKQKAKSLTKYLEKNDLESIDLFITDHFNDSPIIKIAKKTIVINPNKELHNWLKENFINFELRKMN